MIRMDRYSLDQAKKSLAICDHMNVDIEWLIVRVEQLQKENAILQKRVDVFERAKLIWERRNGGASELNDASQEANHYNWLDEQNEKLQSRLADLEKENESLKIELGRPYDKVDRLFEANKKLLARLAECENVLDSLPYHSSNNDEFDNDRREYFKKWGGE